MKVDDQVPLWEMDTGSFTSSNHDDFPLDTTVDGEIKPFWFSIFMKQDNSADALSSFRFTGGFAQEAVGGPAG